LLLSLTFADVRIKTGAIRNSVDAEAGLLGDTLKNLDAYDSAEAETITVQLVEYIDAVSDSRVNRLTRITTRVPVFLYIAVLAFLWSNAMLSIFTPRTRRWSSLAVTAPSSAS